MPINLNLRDIETFNGLPDGEYYGEVSGIKYRAPKAAGKNGQLQCQYLVLDGEQTGRTQSEFLTLNTGFLVAWLEKFGIDKDTPGLQIDDEDPNGDEALLLDGEPIILGSKVIFSVAPDKKDAQYTRTTLISVEENTLDAAPAPAPVRAPRATAAPRRAAPAEAQDDATDEADEAEAPAPRATVARRPVAPTRAAAPRRTLR